MELKLKVRIIIEILGSPKEHVSKVIKEVVDNLDKREIKVLKKEVSQPKKVENFFSSFAEVELKCDWEKLIDICFDFLPSVVEIVEPAEMKFDAKVMESLLNDLLAKLHKQSMITRNLHAENVVMKKELGKE